MLPEFAFMEPLSSAVVSEVTIIRPAMFSLCDLCVSNLLFGDTAQGLYSPMAVPQCALRTTSAASAYWPLCRMSLEEADDAALGTVRLSEPGENWNA